MKRMGARHSQFFQGRLRYLLAGAFVLMNGTPFLWDGAVLDFGLVIRLYLLGLLALTVYEARKISLIFVTIWALVVFEKAFSICLRGRPVDAATSVQVVSHVIVLLLLFTGVSARYYLRIRPRFEKVRRLTLAKGRL